jgi:hypothetical protein
MSNCFGENHEYALSIMRVEFAAGELSTAQCSFEHVANSYLVSTELVGIAF